MDGDKVTVLVSNVKKIQLKINKYKPLFGKSIIPQTHQEINAQAADLPY